MDSRSKNIHAESRSEVRFIFGLETLNRDFHAESRSKIEPIFQADLVNRLIQNGEDLYLFLLFYIFIHIFVNIRYDYLLKTY